MRPKHSTSHSGVPSILRPFTKRCVSPGLDMILFCSSPLLLSFFVGEATSDSDSPLFEPSWRSTHFHPPPTNRIVNAIGYRMQNNVCGIIRSLGCIP